MTSHSARHRLYEDAFALLVGTLLVSTGINLYSRVGLLTGGTAGLSFLIHYLSGLPFGLVFFIVNLPFCYFSMRRMDVRFRRKSLIASALVAGFSMAHPYMVQYERLNLFYSAMLGGVLMGTGFVVLFRHDASLGGVNVVALFLQDRYGIRAGKLQMAVDSAVVLASLFIVKPIVLLASLAGAVTLNMVIALNHRPGRYTGA
ncbi:YitT family protein [Paraburkholderia sp.]|uniref:YitT family protein n=1 Tax=Paraburkholderia sp. TaxID=1926495 RepID=UPI0039E2E41F